MSYEHPKLDPTDAEIIGLFLEARRSPFERLIGQTYETTDRQAQEWAARILGALANCSNQMLHDNQVKEPK